ncbi:hypothetical protein [Halorhodospira halophila]|uniref:Integral membrane protein-like protein n=1 Tax=Halorhodospira halophila (strain DSM 244 / SL1) TaxID=349124 RepID=A1WTW2_HALHL|nr:hypothetical protein [Halorhodospira halophila]ABM61124.1 hypothetical protein Hhal_0330 [Halorhodospira halophila SL1]MBK1730165.1 hypothetical protein [Halorhodospira halophila]
MRGALTTLALLSLLVTPLVLAGGDPTAPPRVMPQALGLPGAPGTEGELPRPGMVLREGGQRFARFDGRWYRLNEEVEGARIVRIGSYGVDLEVYGERYYRPVVDHGVEKRMRTRQDGLGGKGK